MKSSLLIVLAISLALGVSALNAQLTQPKKATTVQPKTTTKTVQPHDHDHPAPPLPKKAVCVLQPTKGNDVQGNFMLTETGDTTEIIGEVRGLTPGKHGFHIHEFGDLRSDDGTAAGAHYNPEGHKHGGPETAERHVGDLGNITADRTGKAMVNMKVRGLKVHFVVGRSLVVHAKEDDLKTDPSGDSGPRIAVGVIGITTEKPPAPAPSKAAAKTTTKDK
jgi:Cu-Zn family superoxide dismutase